MRKSVLFTITVLTFPLILSNILSVFFIPLLPLFNSEAVHIVLIAELSIWLLVCLSSLFLGRAHCSHSCAMFGMFEIISNITKSKEMMSMSYPKALKYIMRLVWILGFGFILACVLVKAFGGFEISGIYTDPIVIAYYSLFFISAILSITVGRSNVEHYVCPFSPWMLTGIEISKKLHIPSLRVVADKDKCIGCKKCSRECLLNHNVYERVQNEFFDPKDCSSCFACVNSCKQDAIKKKWTR